MSWLGAENDFIFVKPGRSFLWPADKNNVLGSGTGYNRPSTAPIRNDGPHRVNRLAVARGQRRLVRIGATVRRMPFGNADYVP